MYRLILVPLDLTDADAAVLDHVVRLAEGTDTRLLLLHVADGWAARHQDELSLRDSEEIKADLAILAARAAGVGASGLQVQQRLERGDPVKQIVCVSRETGADLVAMATHGHRALSDLFHGATVDKVRHLVDVPVLLVPAGHTKAATGRGR